ncbi:ATP-binding cassette sub-family C member 10 isoform X2 [Palaemon carinicauda]|uniref:ATP-binding cassette sub-family C member 10 isoform X2 n=1 Tax=Palaemon carinicauda TaxID=392227 RepID=UPI0035B60FD6
MSRIFFNVTAFCGNMDFESWNSKKLNFGLCFQKALLDVPTFSLLAIVSAYYIGKQSEWVVRRKKQMAIIHTRIAISVLSLFVCVLEPVLYVFVGQALMYWVDALVVSVQTISWLVHLGYLTSLRTRLSLTTRGPTPVIFSWLLTFLCTINLARTAWYKQEGLPMVILEIMRYTTLSQLVLQVFYLFTLFPKGSVGTSQYQELRRETNERTPLMETSYNDYSGFHEAADPYHLGIGEERVNIFSYLTFHWVNSLMEKGSLGYLQSQDDLHDLPIEMRTDVIAQKVHKTILMSQPVVEDSEGTATINSENYSLLRILSKCFGLQFFSIGILKLIGDGLGFAGPLLLNQLVSFIDKKEEAPVKGYSYAGGLIGAALVGSFCGIHYNYLIAKVNLRVRAALISTVYRKVLLVSTANLGKFTTGEVVNMMSTDTDRVVNFCQSFHAFWSLPVQMAVTLFLLYQQIGIAFVSGVAIAFLLIPINKWLATKIGHLSVEMMTFKDRRVGLLKEVLSMIKTVKLNAWEGTFKDRILDERYGEVKALAGRKYLDAACVYFWAATPVLIPIFTFSTYIALGNPLDPARVFTAVALFNMLIMPLNAFPWVINGLVEAWVSLKRIERLMKLPEQDLMNYYTVVPEMSHKESELQILITNGNFSWTEMSSHRKERHIHFRDQDASPSGSQMSLIESQNGFTFEEEVMLPILRHIDMQMSKGQIVAVVGRVGSGKTSLLNAILAEMNKSHGVVAVASLHTGFGLATQEPWIQNATIKDNILFGSSLDISRYRTVISACALEDDLRGFPRKDETVCGENGALLSGGQRARVALARAVYQNKSIYILDDVLSAVDGPVARHIMRHCIQGFLSGKTVILMTHHVSLLTRVDWIIHMHNGTIESQGPPAVILSNLLTPDELSDDWWNEADVDSSGEVSRRPSLDIFTTTDFTPAKPAERRKGSHEEERDYGELNAAVYLTYFSAVGAFLAVAIAISLILMQTSRNLTDLWLSYWVTQVTRINSTGTTLYVEDQSLEPWFETGTQAPSSMLSFPDTFQWLGSTNPVLATQELKNSTSSVGVDQDTRFYLTVYGILATSNTLFTLMRAFLFAYGGLCAAKNLHRKLLDAVLYAKITFFTNNPLGRILNRFSTDVYTIDDTLPFQMNILLAQVSGLIGTVVVTIYGLPWITLLYIPLAFVYYTIQNYYRYTSRDLKRIHSVSLSPLYEHFTETLQGLTVIRAMRAGHRFSVRADSLLEVSQRAQFDIQIASQWLNLRLQLIGLTVLAGVAILSLLQHHFDAVDAGLVGLVISYALTISGFLNNVVGTLTETERELVSVERVHQYFEGAEPENREGTTAPPIGWLSHGSIKFQNVHLRYNYHNPYALKKVNFEVGASEKIGIIGRTGAGKSSIFMALFRLVELSRGRIFVDNVDISRLNLKKLRSNMAIVTQDAFVFSGTIRENLDPNGESIDTQVWQALRSCHLGGLVQTLGGLEARVEEAGRSMSAGQRQLFCLARALLCRTKIVCIDEGTSQLDNETDEQIQQTIRSVFRNKTVLIIAHRVHTVRDCDRILVMDQGEVVESGRPMELLSNRESHFYSILHSQ